MPPPAQTTSRIWFLSRHLNNREAQIVFGFSVMNALLGLITNRVITQAIPPVALGELYLFMNLALWITTPTSSAFIYVTRHWPEAIALKATVRFAKGITTGMALQAVLALVIALALRSLGIGIGGAAAVVMLVAVSMGQAIVQAVGPVFSMERRRVMAGFLELLGTPVRPLALTIGALILGRTASALVMSQAVYGLVYAGLVCVCFGWVLRQHSHRSSGPTRGEAHPGSDPLSVAALASYMVPFLIAGIATQLAASAERWGLARLVDPGETAIFVQAVGLSTAVVGASTGFIASYFQPIIVQAAAGREDPLGAARRNIWRYLIFSGAVMAVVVIVSAVTAQWLTPILFGPKYARVAYLLPWTVLGASFFGVGQALFMVPFVARDSVWPNVVRIVGLFAYAATLFLYRPAATPALGYSRIYAVAQAVYALTMCGVAALHFRRSRRLAGRRQSPGVVPTLN